MSKELEQVDVWKRQNDVVELFLKGEMPWVIAKQLGMKTPEVKEVLESWRKYAQNDTEIKGRAREALVGMDEHYNMIIKQLWQTVEQADLAEDLKTKNAVLKNLADIEAKRLDSLQKAGLLDDQKLGDEIAETQARLDAVKALLKDVTSKCDHCRVPIAQGIGKIWNEVTTIEVKADRA